MPKTKGGEDPTSRNIGWRVQRDPDANRGKASKMALTSVQLTHQLEKAIRSHFIDLREADNAQINEKMSISMLALYSLMEKQFADQNITTGFFNKIVADMRRAGIIDISGSFVCLSSAAWDLHRKAANTVPVESVGGGK